MSGHGEKMTRAKERAIAALLSAPSVAEAAKAIGVNENTLLRWLKDTGFQTSYRQARRAVVQQAVVQVQQATGTAVTTLLAVMRDGAAPASAKVSAAKAVLEMAIRAVELEDLETRIAALEATQPERP